MARYSQTVSATSNAAANTEDTFIDVSVPAGSQGRLKCIEIVSDNTGTADNLIRVKVQRKSASGAGGVAGTVVRQDPAMRATGATTSIKSGTTAFAAGTITDTITGYAINERGIFRWVPSDPQMEVVWGLSGAAQILGINILVSAVSRILRVTVYWDE